MLSSHSWVYTSVCTVCVCSKYFDNCERKYSNRRKLTTNSLCKVGRVSCSVLFGISHMRTVTESWGEKKKERETINFLILWSEIQFCHVGIDSKEVESPSLSTAGALGILCCMRKACCTPHHCKIQRCWSTNVVRLLAGVWCHVKWQVWLYHTVQCSYQVADNTVSPVNSWGNPYPVIKKNASDFIKNL